MLECPLSDPFPHNDPEEQAEFLRNRLYDRLVNLRGDGPIGAADLRYLLGLLDGTDRAPRRLSVIAEIGVTERLLAQGARIRVEVPNPEGFSADLEVTIGEARFFLHLKRLNDPTPRSKWPPTIPEALNTLESIPRPYRVGVRVQSPLDSSALQLITDDLRTFLLAAHLGDRHVVRGDDGGELATAIVSAPNDIDHIELITGIIDRTAPLVERAHRLLGRAYRQFVPGAENVILLIGGDELGGDAMDLALRGSHEERWDRFPLRHQRIAHGRAGDGLWHEQHFERSRLAVWLADPFADGRLWQRENTAVDPQVDDAIGRFFRTEE